MNSTYLLAVVDLVAVLVLAMAVYYPRHRRADLVTAFIAVNVGVLAVTIVLSSSAATVGLGLGLFGVLSIIRLRSDELGQHEIAYYFAALAIGLIGGLGTADIALSVSLMAGLVGVLALADSRLLHSTGCGRSSCSTPPSPTSGRSSSGSSCSSTPASPASRRCGSTSSTTPRRSRSTTPPRRGPRSRAPSATPRPR